MAGIVGDGRCCPSLFMPFVAIDEVATFPPVRSWDSRFGVTEVEFISASGSAASFVEETPPLVIAV